METIVKSLWVGLPILSYLLGSVSWGLLLTRRFTDVDIRKHGSANIGATNVYRSAGPSLALWTLAGDLLKGLVPVWTAGFLSTAMESADLFYAIVALGAILGHLFPIYTGFKGGGKGVATATGCFLILAPIACMISVMVFILTVWVSNRVSVGSLIATIMLPVFIYITNHSPPITGCAGLAAMLILIRHIPNIKRLISGTEHKFR